MGDKWDEEFLGIVNASVWDTVSAQKRAALIEETMKSAVSGGMAALSGLSELSPALRRRQALLELNAAVPRLLALGYTGQTRGSRRLLEKARRLLGEAS